MKTLIKNFLNGNLKTARTQAKRFTHRSIRESLIAHHGFSERKAALTADYLKTGLDFQAACDAV